MTVFVAKGDAPLTDAQLEKRAQRHITKDWPTQAREKSIRLSDGQFDAYMTTFSANHDVNTLNNIFNWQLSEYRKATARLAQYRLADGRSEVWEDQPTGEQMLNEETGEIEDVTEPVLVQTAVEPLEPTVTRMVYSEDDPMEEPTEETVENPLITKDNEERAAAQAVVDATPQEVKDFD